MSWLEAVFSTNTTQRS